MNPYRGRCIGLISLQVTTGQREACIKRWGTEVMNICNLFISPKELDRIQIIETDIEKKEQINYKLSHHNLYSVLHAFKRSPPSWI